MPEAARSALLDAALVGARQRRVLVGVPFTATLIAVAVSFVLPRWYTATTKILPPQQSQSNAVAILGQLGAITGGANPSLGLKNPSDIYVVMLKSRTVADALIERFELRQTFGEMLLQDSRRELARRSQVTVGREGVIAIDYEDKDAKRAAEIANAYVEELRNVTLNLAISEAGQRRLFFELQLKKSKNDLVAAEASLRKFTEDSGLVNPPGQIGLSVAASAALRAQITAKEVQLTATRTYATDSNPDVKRALQELAGLRTELAKVENSASSGKGGTLVPFGKAPEIGLEYLRHFREMKYREALFEVLSKQYEIARIDEAKDATLIQVLDKAVPPERPSWPRHWILAFATFAISVMAAVSWVLFRLWFQRIKSDPAHASKLADILRLVAGHEAS